METPKIMVLIVIIFIITTITFICIIFIICSINISNISIKLAYPDYFSTFPLQSKERMITSVYPFVSSFIYFCFSFLSPS